jgi:sorbitol/mannitol transport system substrate-binding protein
MVPTRFAFRFAAALLVLSACGCTDARKTITIATVNNKDMIVMQRLSSEFEKAHPEVRLEWVVLEENVLRQRVTTDIATRGGQFDVLTIGTYEAPIWARRGWLTALEELPPEYDVEDILPPVRKALSHEGKLYALPFYAESSMLYYRKDIFEKAGITVPEQPTYKQIREWAAAVHDPENELYGICLRGKPGWGENMAYLTTLVNTFGGQWFDMEWNPVINTAPWREALTLYVDLLRNFGPPGASSNGFNESLALFAAGKCAMWIDATVAAGMLFDPEESQVHDRVGFARAPIGKHPGGTNWLWAWSLAIPQTSDAVEEARAFVTWATSKAYIRQVAESEGWVAVPPGTRASTYASAEYRKAAPFADLVLDSIRTANPLDCTANPKPYIGVQCADTPEFQAVGTQVGQMVAAALTGGLSVEDALTQAQAATERTMKAAEAFR